MMHIPRTASTLLFTFQLIVCLSLSFISCQPDAADPDTLCSFQITPDSAVVHCSGTTLQLSISPAWTPAPSLDLKGVIQGPGCEWPEQHSSAFLSLCTLPGYTVRFENSSVSGAWASLNSDLNEAADLIAVAIVAPPTSSPPPQLPTITIDRSNVSYVDGASAIAIHSSSVVVSHSSFTNNKKSAGAGAGLLIAASASTGSLAGSFTATINNCTFVNNTAFDGAGLLIQAAGSSLPTDIQVLHSQFRHNVAHGSNCAPEVNNQGGGIMLNLTASNKRKIKISLADSSFISNAGLNAGGVLVDLSGGTSSVSTLFDISGTAFLKNQAVSTCADCRVNPRCVGNSRGGVHGETPPVCTYCRINGGALKLDMRSCNNCNAVILANSTQFIDNTVNGYNVAGAALMLEMVESVRASVTVKGDDLLFQGNMVHGTNWADAGAVRVIAVVADSGGRAHAVEPHFAMEGSRIVFKDNVCMSDCSDAAKPCVDSKDGRSVYRSGLGGGLDVDVAGCKQPKVSLNVTSLVFQGNVASYLAGALAVLLIDTVGSFTMQGNSTVFENNTALVNGGGAFFLTNRGNVTIDMLTHYAVFKNNFAMAKLATSSDGFDTGAVGVGTHNGGAGIYMGISGTNETIFNFKGKYALFEGNYAEDGKGAAIHIAGSDAGNVMINFKFNQAILRSNSAKYGGGAVHYYLSGSTATVDMNSPTIYENNTAQYGPGGAIYLNLAPLTIGAISKIHIGMTNFSSNTARSGTGGAVHVNGDPRDYSPCLCSTTCNCSESATQQPVLTLTRVRFANNSAFNGGGLFLLNCTSHVMDATFIGNKAVAAGGALYAKSSYWTRFVEAIFVGNSAFQGGAAFGTVGDSQESNNIFFSSCAFHANTASEGGALYLFGGGTMLCASSVTGNQASARGGAAVFTNVCGDNVDVRHCPAPDLSLSPSLPDAALSEPAHGSSPTPNYPPGSSSTNLDVWSPSLPQNAIPPPTGQDHPQNSTSSSHSLNISSSSSVPLTYLPHTPLSIDFFAQGPAFCSPLFPSLCGTQCRTNLAACFLCTQWTVFNDNAAPAGAAVFFSMETPLQQVQVINATMQYSSSLMAAWERNASVQLTRQQAASAGTYEGGQMSDPSTQLVSALPAGDLHVEPLSPFLVFPSTSGPRGRIPFSVQAGNLSGVRVLAELVPAPRPGKGPYITRFVTETDENGVANFPDLRIIGADPSRFALKVTTPDYPQVKPQTLDVTIRPCILGEVNDTGINTCERCLDGSFAPLDGTLLGTRPCESCPAGADCKDSQGVAIPKESFWQSALQLDSVQACLNLAACRGSRQFVRDSMARCMDNLDCLMRCEKYVECMNACKHNVSVCAECEGGACMCVGDECGMASYPDVLCSHGYFGHLCGSCIPGYGAAKLFTCRRCYSQHVAFILYLLALLIVCGVVIFISYNVVDTALDPDDGQLKVSEVFKVLSLHLQQLLIISRLLIDWPISISGMFSTLQYIQGPSESDAISLDCLGALSPAAKLWLSLLFPGIVAVTSFVLMRCLRKACNQADMFLFKKEVWNLCSWWDQFVVTSIVTLHFLYTTLVSTTFNPLTCALVQSANGLDTKRYWAYDMRLACWEREHLAAGLPVAILGILGLCVLVPIALWQGIRHLKWHVVPVKVRFSFLYAQYRPGMRNWEAYVCFTTVIMVAINMFAKEAGPFHQLLLFLWLLELNRSLVHALHPFRSKLVHSLYIASAKCIQLTCLAVLALQGTSVFSAIGDIVGRLGGEWLLKGMNIGGELIVIALNVGLAVVIVVVIVVLVVVKRRQGFFGAIGEMLDPVEGFLARRLGCKSFHDTLDRKKDLGLSSISSYKDSSFSKHGTDDDSYTGGSTDEDDQWGPDSDCTNDDYTEDYYTDDRNDPCNVASNTDEAHPPVGGNDGVSMNDCNDDTGSTGNGDCNGMGPGRNQGGIITYPESRKYASSGGIHGGADSDETYQGCDRGIVMDSECCMNSQGSGRGTVCSGDVCQGIQPGESGAVIERVSYSVQVNRRGTVGMSARLNGVDCSGRGSGLGAAATRQHHTDDGELEENEVGDFVQYGHGPEYRSKNIQPPDGSMSSAVCSAENCRCCCGGRYAKHGDDRRFAGGGDDDEDDVDCAGAAPVMISSNGNAHCNDRPARIVGKIVFCGSDANGCHHYSGCHGEIGCLCSNGCNGGNGSHSSDGCRSASGWDGDKGVLSRGEGHCGSSNTDGCDVDGGDISIQLAAVRLRTDPNEYVVADSSTDNVKYGGVTGKDDIHDYCVSELNVLFAETDEEGGSVLESRESMDGVRRQSFLNRSSRRLASGRMSNETVGVEERQEKRVDASSKRLMLSRSGRLGSGRIDSETVGLEEREERREDASSKRLMWSRSSRLGSGRMNGEGMDSGGGEERGNQTQRFSSGTKPVNRDDEGPAVTREGESREILPQHFISSKSGILPSSGMHYEAVGAGGEREAGKSLSAPLPRLHMRPQGERAVGMGSGTCDEVSIDMTNAEVDHDVSSGLERCTMNSLRLRHSGSGRGGEVREQVLSEAEEGVSRPRSLHRLGRSGSEGGVPLHFASVRERGVTFKCGPGHSEREQDVSSVKPLQSKIWGDAEGGLHIRSLGEEDVAAARSLQSKSRRSHSLSGNTGKELSREQSRERKSRRSDSLLRNIGQKLPREQSRERRSHRSHSLSVSGTTGEELSREQWRERKRSSRRVQSLDRGKRLSHMSSGERRRSRVQSLDGRGDLWQMQSAGREDGKPGLHRLGGQRITNTSKSLNWLLELTEEELAADEDTTRERRPACGVSDSVVDGCKGSQVPVRSPFERARAARREEKGGCTPGEAGSVGAGEGENERRRSLMRGLSGSVSRALMRLSSQLWEGKSGDKPKKEKSGATPTNDSAQRENEQTESDESKKVQT